MTSEEMSELNC